MNDFWICFVPLFVAVDAIGVVPIFLSLTEDMEPQRRLAVVVQSVITAASVAIAFLLFGPALLSFVGVTIPDFMIAGGVLLLAVSLGGLLTGEKKHGVIDAESLGAVPIGIPLITGPAVLTTCILLANSHGKMVTALAAVSNIILAGITFALAKPITKVLGRTGTRTLSKVAGLFLSAIAVMLIRRGLVQAISDAAH
jgi:multiple antibiotic resistance protein